MRAILPVLWRDPWMMQEDKTVVDEESNDERVVLGVGEELDRWRGPFRARPNRVAQKGAGQNRPATTSCPARTLA